MKRVLFFALFTWLVFSLFACDASNSETNTVSNAKLTERENVLLTSTADQSFVFDFNVEDQYKEVAVWVEKYESGNLVREVNHISIEIKNNGMIFFTTNPTGESDQSLFTIGVHSDGGTGTGWSTETLLKDDFSVVWGSNPSDSIPVKGQMVLASICYASGDEGMSSLPTGLYSNVESHLEELKEYEVVYLLRSEFK